MSDRVKSEWRSYCIYSGRHLPEDALSDEHAIPMSLGGGRSTLIRVSKKLNNELGTKIDGAIANDPLVQFGRRDADARGHSRKPVVPRWKGARPWQSGPIDASPERLNVDFPATGSPEIYDRRSGKAVASNIFNRTALLVPNLQIDSDARLKFCIKTLLGVGWKVFGPKLLSSINTGALRTCLGIKEAPLSEPVRLRYLDPFVAPDEHAYVKMIEQNLVRECATTILARENQTELEWSVSCVGHYVGSIVVQTNSRVLPAEIPDDGGLLLIAAPGTLKRVVVNLVA